MQKVCVYYESWSPAWTDDPKKMSLSGISAPTTLVNLSFVLPACAYVSEEGRGVAGKVRQTRSLTE